MSLEREYSITVTVNGANAVLLLRDIGTEITKLETKSKETAASLGTVERQLKEVGGAANGARTSMAALTGDMEVMPNLMGQTAEGARGVTGAIRGLAESGLIVNGVTILFTELFRAVQEAAEGVKTVRENLQELGDEAAKTRAEMTELANLKGQSFANDQVVAGVVEFGLETGLSIDEARQYLEQFEGSAPAGRQKGNITAEVEKGLMSEGARFATRSGLDLKTAGVITGLISQYGKIESVEAGAGKLGAITYGLNEGVGNVKPLMQSLLKTAGSIVEEEGGPVSTLEELAAILGVASTKHQPNEAGTYVRKAVRGLREFTGPKGDSLRRLGITEQDSFVEAMGKIAPGIRQADKEGTGGDIYLRSLGFNDSAEISAVVEMGRDWEIVKQRVAKSAEGYSGAKVIAGNREYTRSIAGQHRQANINSQAADYIKGHENEPVQIMRQNAATRLKDAKALQTKELAWLDQYANTATLVPLTGAPNQMDNRINYEALRALQTAAENAGIDTSKDPRFNTGELNIIDGIVMPGLGQDTVDVDVLKDLYSEYHEKIEAAGVNPFGGASGLKSKVKMIGRDKAKTEAARAAMKPGQAPAGNPGVTVPARPAAQGVGPAAAAKAGAAAKATAGGGPKVTQSDDRSLQALQRLVAIAEYRHVREGMGGTVELPAAGGPVREYRA